MVVNRMPAAFDGLQSESWPQRVEMMIVWSGSPLPYSSPITIYAPLILASMLKSDSGPVHEKRRYAGFRWYFSLTNCHVFVQSSGCCLYQRSTSVMHS